jgi:AcrR family transcriptional regulator
LINAAAELDPGQLTFRALAKRAGLSPAMPVYFFGTMARLHAALAAEGYRQLVEDLRSARTSRSPGAESLGEACLRYHRFGVTHERLWRMMHSQILWGQIRDAHAGTRAFQRRQTRAERNYNLDGGDYFKLVEAGRSEAFQALVEAAGPISRASELVHLLTRFVDGGLFQRHFEMVEVEDAEVEESLRTIISAWS